MILHGFNKKIQNFIIKQPQKLKKEKHPDFRKLINPEIHDDFQVQNNRR